MSLYAAHILSNQPIEGKPEFFQHALIHFLNRMVYKNPKKQRDDVNTALGTKGSSIMQPMAAHRGTSIMLKKSGGNDVNVNTEAFWQKKIEDVPVDQAFFHKYFTQKKILKPATGKKGAKSAGSDDDEADFGGSKKRGVDADDDGEDGSDMDEDEVWNAMMSDMPKDALEDVDDDDEDLSDGELEELMLSDLEEEEGAGDDDDEDDEDEIDEESFGKDESNWKDDDGDDEEANMFMDEEDDMVASDEEAAAEESDQEEKGKRLLVAICVSVSMYLGVRSTGVVMMIWLNPDLLSPLRFQFLVAASPCLCNCEHMFINTRFLTLLKIGRDKKRRKKVALPMFASMEDYAHLIDQEDSE